MTLVLTALFDVSDTQREDIGFFQEFRCIFGETNYPAC